MQGSAITLKTPPPICFRITYNKSKILIPGYKLFLWLISRTEMKYTLRIKVKQKMKLSLRKTWLLNKNTFKVLKMWLISIILLTTPTVHKIKISLMQLTWNWWIPNFSRSLNSIWIESTSVPRTMRSFRLKMVFLQELWKILILEVVLSKLDLARCLCWTAPLRM